MSDTVVFSARIELESTLKIFDIPFTFSDQGLRNFSSGSINKSFVLGNARELYINKLYVGYPYTKLLNFFQITAFPLIADFISKHPFLENALFEIHNAVRTYFQEENLRLDFYEDPEGQLPNELAIYIQTSISPSSALEKLESFDTNFWINRIDDYEEYVTVNIEYM